ncbi:MAG: hypothetical protein HY525_06285 [Betaproteobacteria bacterium]|nr:hypothetical protein [Betaproteobacteria bacterium]
MAAEISEKLGIKPELRKGDNGVFDVVADGVTIFSKDREGRFPKPGEIVRALHEAT